MNTYIRVAVQKDLCDADNIAVAKSIFSGDLSAPINTMFDKIEQRGIPASLFKASENGDALSHIARSAATVKIGRNYVRKEHMAHFQLLEAFWLEAASLFTMEDVDHLEMVIQEAVWGIVAKWISKKVPVECWDLDGILDAIGVQPSSFYARVGAEYLGLVKVFLLDWNEKFQSK